MMKVSFLMSVRGNPINFEKALQSMLNQTYQNIEIVIILDLASDEITNILNKHRNERVKIIVNREPKNLARSLNLGIRHCSGSWIARLDADDIALPNRIETQINIINCFGTNLLMVCGNAKGLSPKYGHIDIRELNIEDFLTDNPIIHPTVMFSKEYLNRNLYNEKYKFSQDYELWSRMIMDGIIIWTNDYLIEFDTRKRESKYVLEQEKFFLKGNFKFLVNLITSRYFHFNKKALFQSLLVFFKRSLNYLFNIIRLKIGRFD